MAKSTLADFDHCLALLRAALGDFNPKKTLSTIVKRVPEFGTFEWMLTIIGLEIDLRVDIPESLADNLDCRAEEFAREVANLPKIDSPGYTLECLGLVAQALLSLELDAESAAAKQSTRSAKRAPARGSKAPRKGPVPAKRATKTQRPSTSAVAKKAPAKKSPSTRGKPAAKGKKR